MATTLQNLLDAVIIETRDPDGVLFQDPEKIYNINQAYRITFQEIANSLKDYFVLPVLEDIVANQREYELPEDFLRMVRAEIIIGNTWAPMKRYQRGYASNYSGSGSSGISFSYNVPTFDFEGNNFILEPTPKLDVADGMRWTYAQAAVDLIDLTDEIHAGFKDIWRDVVVLRAAKACFGQMEAVGGIVSPTILNERLAEAEKQMNESLALRDLAPIKKRRKGYLQ